MTATNMSIYQIGNFGVKTFSVLPNVQTKEPAMNLVYISSIDGKNAQVTIKPIAATNEESFNGAKDIVAKAKLAWIKFNDGINLGISHNRTNELPKNGFSLVLETKDQKINLGQVKNLTQLQDPGYVYLKNVYLTYFNFVKAELSKMAVKT